MAYETLIIEHEEPILIIRLNRPNALNALNSKLLEELNNAFNEESLSKVGLHYSVTEEIVYRTWLKRKESLKR